MNKKNKQNLIYIFFFIINIIFISGFFINNIFASTNNIIRVAFPIQQEFSFIDDNGELAGYNYEYLMKISQYTGWEYEFIIIDENDLNASLTTAKNMILKGEADILGGISHSLKEDPMFLFSTIPAGTNQSTLAVLDSNNSINLNNYYNNPDFTVALNIHNERINEHFKGFTIVSNFTAKYIYVDSDQEAINCLYKGEADAVLSQEITAKNHLINIETFSSEPFYFISTKGNTDLINDLDTAMSNILLDNPYTNNNLKERFFNTNHTNNIYFSKEDRAFLDNLDVINIGFTSGNEPFYKLDAMTGEVSGISIDILDNISKILKIDFNYIYCETKQELYDMLQKQELDIIGVMPYNYELGRYLDIILSSPYISTNAVRLNKSYKPVDMLSYDEMYAHYITNTTQNYIIIEDLSKAIHMLNNGQIEYLYTNPYMADYLIQNNAYYDIESYQINEVLSNICFGVNKSMSLELLQFINHAILHIGDTELNKIILNNSYSLKEFSIIDIITDNPVISILSITTILLMILSVAILMHKNKKRALYQIINLDHLTGLMTRYKFIEETQELLKNAQPNQYLLISVDIDNFQYINESYGYKYGSEVLVKLAEQLKAYFGEHAIIAREKDDTFLILVDNSNSFYNKEIYLENISNAIKNVLTVKIKINTSQGVYYIKDKTEPISYIIDCANSARILGKKSYTSTLAEFTEEMRLDRENKNNIVTRMEDALNTYEFKVFYQAKVLLDNNKNNKNKNNNRFKIVGAEALVRWIPKDGTMIFPDQFIPLFENNGFILKLDYYIFEQVCRFIRHQNNLNNLNSLNYLEKIEIPKVSVNLSSITLAEPDLIEVLISIINKYNLSNSDVELEITESSMMKNVQDVINKIDRLKELGFSISMDDFGSGISSLNNLKDINVDVLKIDKEFMSESLYGKKGIPIIKNVINMSKELNLLTVAEGVETKEHVELLTELGCDIAQGYYFSKPISEVDFVEYIKKFDINFNE